ncbi:AAA family ATPase [Deltaproteobacteria bacterium IMCC39524]|nr:AAA family ATPase [Deltaproteobacteria bacterium IMCC39524]
MYLNFYQLHKKPFSLAPDPEFLFLSQQHKDALGAIVYGIREREGFVSIVGEVGTGKTTIIRSFLHKAGRNKILPIFIFNSKITFAELMKTFLSEIGLDVDAIQEKYNVNDMVRLAYNAMLEKTREGKNLVLIIDEAQNMPVETLGSLCILSNFETAKAKLIQIVLVGQPELQKKLDLHELRQLRQRIAYRALITPLSIKDSMNYLHHRLSLSAIGKTPAFTASAIRRIVEHSKGIPRVINILCENSLVAGYGSQKKPVSLKLVKQVIDEYEGKRLPKHFQLRNVTGSVLVVLLTAFLVASYLPSRANSPVEEQASIRVLPEAPLQSDTSNEGEIPSSKNVVKPVVLETVIAPSAQEIRDTDDSGSSKLPAKTLSPQPVETLTLANLPEILREQSTIGAAEDKNVRSEEGSYSSRPTERYIPSKQSTSLRVAQKGDTVSKLFLEKYGFYNTRALEWIKSHNPHIANMDQIQIDQIIYFPAIEP